MNQEQATEMLDTFKRQIAARCAEAKLAHFSYVGFWYTDRGLESFIHKITHPYYEVSIANELGDAVFKTMLDTIQRLPGSEVSSPSTETITVIPGPAAKPAITNDLFRIRENLDALINQTSDSEKLERQCRAIEEINGIQFLHDFCNCDEVVCELTWSTYYMSLTKYSVWFAALFNKVPYEMLPPNSRYNGTKGWRMLVKYI